MARKQLSRRGFDRRAQAKDVAACYRLFLGRQPDERGHQGYLHLVRSGISVDSLTRYFMSSPEFRERIQRSAGMAQSEFVRVAIHNGMDLYIRSDDYTVGAEIRRNGSYEVHISQEILRLLRPGSIFVDVGASLGYFTILAGRAVGPEGRVIACEPGPQNHSVLLLNTIANGLNNVRIVTSAVSDAPDIFLYHRIGGNGSIVPYDGDPGSIGTRDLIRAHTLDEILQTEPRVDVIKVDVEGAEGRVIAGANETLNRHRPTLLFEFSPPSLQSVSGVTGEDFLSNLVALGYAFRVFGSLESVTVPADAVLRHYRQQPADHIDVMAVPWR